MEKENKAFELSDEQLAQVTGGEELEHNYSVFACDECGHEVQWPGTKYKPHWSYEVDCKGCGKRTDYHWVRTVY